MHNKLQDDNKKPFSFEYRDDGVYLIVSPPGEAKLPSSNEIIDEIKLRNIELPDYNVVQIAINRVGEEILLAPPQEKEAVDGTCEVELSNERMEAYLLITPARGGKEVTREDVNKILESRGVVKGIDEKAIEIALSMDGMSESIIVAQGKAAIDGEPAKIEYKFSPDGMPAKPKELVDGRVDFYNLDLIQNVNAGDVLAMKIPATPGTPGYKVTGEELVPRPGKDIKLLAGKNVEIIDDGLKAVAISSGHVLLSGNKVTVSAVLQIDGDVDFSTGNIDFKGSVLIKGMVNDGFTVKAEDDIEIQKSVSGGFIHCGGNLKIKNGMVGRNKGMAVCRGSIYTQFIENASVNAGKDIVVGEAILHSNISAGKNVTVGGKGVIVGGIIRAGEEIAAKVIGSNMATATELETGINPQLRLQYAKIRSELVAKENELDKAEKAIKLLKKLEAATGQLPADKKAIYLKVSKTFDELHNKVEGLKQELEELESQVIESERGKILIEGIIHQGVKITIGSAVLNVTDDMRFACLTKEGEDIQISPYK